MLDRPVPAENIVAEDLDEDICLYRPDIDEVLVLNQTAGDVWRLSDGQLSVSAIAATLAHAYAAEPTDLQADVRAVVDDLAGRGYLVDQATRTAP
jgi:Coenzyme PQQ synthesis protein D (PqqD)